MSDTEFRELASERGMMEGTPSWEACRLVMVEGKTPGAAAKLAKLHRSSVTRPLKRLGWKA